jgi:hypothetical protein
MKWIIGNFYKTRGGRKAVLVGDYTISKHAKVDFPLVFGYEDGTFVVTNLEGKCLGGEDYVMDIVDIWDESKPKVKRSQAVIRRPGMPPSVTSYFYNNEQEVRDDYYGNVTILEFPINGIWREFEE